MTITITQQVPLTTITIITTTFSLQVRPSTTTCASAAPFARPLPLLTSWARPPPPPTPTTEVSLFRRPRQPRRPFQTPTKSWTAVGQSILPTTIIWSGYRIGIGELKLWHGLKLWRNAWPIYFSSVWVINFTYYDHLVGIQNRDRWA